MMHKSFSFSKKMKHGPSSIQAFKMTENSLFFFKRKAGMGLAFFFLTKITPFGMFSHEEKKKKKTYAPRRDESTTTGITFITFPSRPVHEANIFASRQVYHSGEGSFLPLNLFCCTPFLGKPS